jgi:DNA-directed RNA polymerase subunit RPC12/RpoP
MSDRSRDLLVRGIAAAKANSKDEAKFYFEWVLRSDAERDQIKDAWLWLSRLTDDPKEKRERLEQALSYDPFDAEAVREIKLLDAGMRAQDVVDPDRLTQTQTNDAPTPIHARRFVCVQCGGRMEFTPDGNALTCAYCGRKQALLAAMDEGAMLQEQDFMLALATARGHTRPTQAQTLKCVGCGVAFVVSPAILALSCPHCGSAYVIERAETQELIEPAGVVPFVISNDQAMRALLAWMKNQGFDHRADAISPVGMYVPVWTFDVGGEVSWNCLVEVNERYVPRSGGKVVFENDLTIPATHTLSAPLSAELESLALDKLAPYDARYLADWTAETYQISVSDASLVARTRVVKKLRGEIEAGFFDAYRDLTVGTSRLAIESYRLILVAIWLAHYRADKQRYTVVINAQTGKPRGEKPARGMKKWFKGLFGNP